MSDPTQAPNNERAELEAKVGKTWDTAELQAEFSVQSFLAPYVLVTRKSDGVTGTLQFQHWPRYYFGWVPDSR